MVEREKERKERKRKKGGEGKRGVRKGYPGSVDLIGQVYDITMFWR